VNDEIASVIAGHTVVGRNEGIVTLIEAKQ